MTKDLCCCCSNKYQGRYYVTIGSWYQFPRSADYLTFYWINPLGIQKNKKKEKSFNSFTVFEDVQSVRRWRFFGSFDGCWLIANIMGLLRIQMIDRKKWILSCYHFKNLNDTVKKIFDGLETWSFRIHFECENCCFNFYAKNAFEIFNNTKTVILITHERSSPWFAYFIFHSQRKLPVGHQSLTLFY